MFPIPLQRTLAIGSLVYAATLWGVMWYPYRLLYEAGVGGIASSFFTYAVPLLALGWLHGRELHRARGRWMWLPALGLAGGAGSRADARAVPRAVGGDDVRAEQRHQPPPWRRHRRRQVGVDLGRGGGADGDRTVALSGRTRLS